MRRAAVFAGPTTVRITETALPSPESTQIRVRLQGCGVCASNLPVWEGRPWFQYPLPSGAPGHEGWGIVDAVGTEITDLQPGDRVAMISERAYAEYDVAERRACVRLPPELATRPFPGEPLACAMNIFARSGIRRGDAVAIVGAGFLGLLLTQLAARAGADVMALSRREYALTHAQYLGASATHTTTQYDAARDYALKMTSGKGFNRVIEVAGEQTTLDLASDLTGEYGRLVIAGYHQDGLRQVNMQQWNWRGIDVINAHERDPRRYVSGIEEAVRAVVDGRMDPFTLFTHSIELDDLSAAFELLRKRPDGFVKALLTFESQR
jgi:threonine dehydrogenase-like Zn-dependent dehydrogenase